MSIDFATLFAKTKIPRTPKGIFDYARRAERRPMEKALVVYFHGRGRILDHGGFNIKSHIEHCGADPINLENIPPPSDGIWVFEGREGGSGPDFNGEYDSWWNGSYRTLTEEEQEEWANIGALDDLWWDDHVRFEDSWPCSHCGKAKQEHLPHQGRGFATFEPTLCPEPT